MAWGFRKKKNNIKFDTKKGKNKAQTKPADPNRGAPTGAQITGLMQDIRETRRLVDQNKTEVPSKEKCEDNKKLDAVLEPLGTTKLKKKEVVDVSNIWALLDHLEYLKAKYDPQHKPVQPEDQAAVNNAAEDNEPSQQPASDALASEASDRDAPGGSGPSRSGQTPEPGYHAPSERSDDVGPSDDDSFTYRNTRAVSTFHVLGSRKHAGHGNDDSSISDHEIRPREADTASFHSYETDNMYVPTRSRRDAPLRRHHDEDERSEAGAVSEYSFGESDEAPQLRRPIAHYEGENNPREANVDSTCTHGSLYELPPLRRQTPTTRLSRQGSSTIAGNPNRTPFDVTNTPLVFLGTEGRTRGGQPINSLADRDEAAFNEGLGEPMEIDDGLSQQTPLGGGIVYMAPSTSTSGIQDEIEQELPHTDDLDHGDRVPPSPRPDAESDQNEHQDVHEDEIQTPRENEKRTGATNGMPSNYSPDDLAQKIEALSADDRMRLRRLMTSGSLVMSDIISFLEGFDFVFPESFRHVLGALNAADTAVTVNFVPRILQNHATFPPPWKRYTFPKALESPTPQAKKEKPITQRTQTKVKSKKPLHAFETPQRPPAVQKIVVHDNQRNFSGTTVSGSPQFNDLSLLRSTPENLLSARQDYTPSTVITVIHSQDPDGKTDGGPQFKSEPPSPSPAPKSDVETVSDVEAVSNAGAVQPVPNAESKPDLEVKHEEDDTDTDDDAVSEPVTAILVKNEQDTASQADEDIATAEYAPFQVNVEGSVEGSVEGLVEDFVEGHMETLPVETPVETPLVETPVEAPVKAPVEPPIETLVAAVEAPAEAPIEAAIETYFETSLERPLKTPPETPVEEKFNIGQLTDTDGNVINLQIDGVGNLKTSVQGYVEEPILQNEANVKPLREVVPETEWLRGKEPLSESAQFLSAASSRPDTPSTPSFMGSTYRGSTGEVTTLFGDDGKDEVKDTTEDSLTPTAGKDHLDGIDFVALGAEDDPIHESKGKEIAQTADAALQQAIKGEQPLHPQPDVRGSVAGSELTAAKAKKYAKKKAYEARKKAEKKAQAAQQEIDSPTTTSTRQVPIGFEPTVASEDQVDVPIEAGKEVNVEQQPESSTEVQEPQSLQESDSAETIKNAGLHIASPVDENEETNAKPTEPTLTSAPKDQHTPPPSNQPPAKTLDPAQQPVSEPTTQSTQKALTKQQKKEKDARRKANKREKKADAAATEPEKSSGRGKGKRKGKSALPVQVPVPTSSAKVEDFTTGCDAATATVENAHVEGKGAEKKEERTAGLMLGPAATSLNQRTKRARKKR